MRFHVSNAYHSSSQDAFNQVFFFCLHICSLWTEAWLRHFINIFQTLENVVSLLKREPSRKINRSELRLIDVNLRFYFNRIFLCFICYSIKHPWLKYEKLRTIKRAASFWCNSPQSERWRSSSEPRRQCPCPSCTCANVERSTKGRPSPCPLQVWYAEFNYKEHTITTTYCACSLDSRTARLQKSTIFQHQFHISGEERFKKKNYDQEIFNGGGKKYE
jgi:hypothetical protein